MGIPLKKVAHRVIYDAEGRPIDEEPAWIKAPPRKRQSDFDRERQNSNVRQYE